MITRNMLRACALATSCLAPLVAYAADDFSVEPTPETPAAATATTPAPGAGGLTGSVGVGVMGIMGNNPNQAGRYNGFNASGVNVGITDLDISSRPAWDSGGVRYYQLQGNDLFFNSGNHLGGVGTDSNWMSRTNNKLANDGSLELKFGDQGTWGADIYYDSITYTGNVIESIYTTTGAQAVLNHGLTPGGQSSFTIPQLEASGAMHAFQMGTRRDIIGGNFKYMWNDWTITGALRHEHKEGSMEEAFDGPWGGTAFGMPVDYDTDRYDISASYNTQRFQSLVQYTFSRFTDNNLFVSLPYPTLNGSAPLQRTAAYSLPPSNDAHYLTIQLASSDIIPRTRLNLNARVGLEMQDDTFAPNTADPGGANLTGANLAGLNSALQGTNGSSPDLLAKIYQVRVSAASRPLANLDTRLYYGVDGRDVSTDQSKVVTGGTGGSAADSTPGLGAAGTNYAYAVQPTWLKQNAGAEVGYRILPESDTRLSIGYRFDDTDRSNAQVGHSTTSTGTIAVTSQVGQNMDGKISMTFMDRSGSINYLGPWYYLGQGYTYSGAYYQAPMTSEAITARLDYTPSNVLSGGMFLQFKNENYSYDNANSGSFINIYGTTTSTTAPFTGEGAGIKRDYALVFGPDLNFRPSKTVNVHLYYTYELLFYDNLGNGACSTAAQAATAACAGTVGYFENKDTSSTHTVGISADWQVSEKLKLKGEYTFSYGSVMFAEFNGVFIANPTTSNQNVSNYPDINSVMNSLKLTATYQIRPQMELLVQGVFTSFHNNDWADTANAIQGAGTTSISLLTPGYGSPNYSVVGLMTGMRIRF